jgi:hypothetical protein
MSLLIRVYLIWSIFADLALISGLGYMVFN